jgi:hypothetical protein
MATWVPRFASISAVAGRRTMFGSPGTWKSKEAIELARIRAAHFFDFGTFKKI